jgi:hypothetical protein
MFRPGTKRAEIAALCNAGQTPRDAYVILRSKVETQVKPWIFSANVRDEFGSRRQPKPMSKQYDDLRHEINRVYALLGKMPADSAAEIPQDLETVEDVPTVEEKPKAKGKQSKADELKFFFNEWKRIRQWIASRVADSGSEAVDSLDTMRPLQAAKAAINRGVSARTLLYAMCLHWSPETRQAAGIASADFKIESDDKGEGYHHLLGYVLKLAEASRDSGGLLPIMLIGAAGTGKSRLLRQLADILELPYAETPMTAGATPSWLLGRWTMAQENGGFVPSQFLEIYSGGGVFNFEEIDAADPNMLIVVNNALASDRLYNPVNGEAYEKHPDFIPVATANTFGLGANRSYTGRERLDAATIDRFRMGRVLIDLDEDLAESLILG